MLVKVSKAKNMVSVGLSSPKTKVQMFSSGTQGQLEMFTRIEQPIRKVYIAWPE